MNSKTISILVLAGAILVAAVAAIVVTGNRKAKARAEADRVEAAADKAKAEAKKAEAEAASDRAKAESQKTALKLAEENRKAQEAEREASANAAEKAKEDRARAEAEKVRAASEAQTAADNRAAEKSRAETARAEAEKAKQDALAEAAKAQAAADALAREKLVADTVIAAQKLYELKQLDLATLERDLLAFKCDLDERERALQPEKTIQDLAWVSMEDTVLGEDGTVHKREKVPYLAENDKSLPKGQRTLAKAQRLLREANERRASALQSNVTSRLEKLYVAAIREDRVTDAEYYKKSLKSLYPGWEYKPPEKDQEVSKE